jgi:hypothetical protein
VDRPSVGTTLAVRGHLEGPQAMTAEKGVR